MSSPTYFDVCVAKNECDIKKDIVDSIADALVGDHVELMQECESLRQQVKEQAELIEKLAKALSEFCHNAGGDYTEELAEEALAAYEQWKGKK